MSRSKNCNDLTANQKKIYQNLSSKEALSEKEKATLSILSKKVQRFNDPELSSAAKNYMLTRFSWERYNRGSLSIHQKSCAIIKGNELEGDAISFVNSHEKDDFTKQTEFISNDYIFGCCDAISSSGKVTDIKVAWSIHNFLPKHISKLSDKHWFQMQGYLDLYDKEVGEIKYVLLNTPEILLERERAKCLEKYQLGEIDSEKFEDDMERLSLNYNYSKVNYNRKIITYVVNRDRELMARVKRKVELCRLWLLEFDKIHSSNKKIVTLSEHHDTKSKASSTECDTDECVENDSGG